MFLLKKLINFFYKSLIILIITFFISLIIDYFLGKKILNLLDGYLVKTEFYGRLLRMDNSIYHHGFMPNVNYKNNIGFEGKFTICTNNHGFRDSCDKKNVSKNFDIGFMGDSFVEGYSVNFEESFVGIFSENRRNLKIANLGVSSYSPKIFYSKLNYLLSEGFKFKEIIFFIDISDLYDDNVNYKLNEDLTISEIDFKNKGLKRRKFLRTNFPLTNFYMYVLKKNRQLNNLKKESPEKNVNPIFNEKVNFKAEWTYYNESNHPEYMGSIEESQQNLINIMSEIYLMLKKNKIQMSIAVYPWPHQLKNDDVNSKHVIMWEKFCKTKCNNFINYFPFFFKEKEKNSFLEVYRKYYFWNDVHFNIEGNKVISSKLIEKF